LYSDCTNERNSDGDKDIMLKKFDIAV